jgi:hypothetical protein
MKIEIKNQSIELYKVTFDEFSFGKPHNLKSSNYEFYIKKNKFIELITPIYENCINELRADDEATEHFHPPYPDAKDYPSLIEFIKINGEHFFDFIYTFLKFDIFTCLLSNQEKDDHIYFLHTLDKIEISKEEVILKGVALCPSRKIE